MAAAAAAATTSAAVPSVTGHGNTSRDSLPSGAPNPRAAGAERGRRQGHDARLVTECRRHWDQKEPETGRTELAGLASCLGVQH